MLDSIGYLPFRCSYQHDITNTKIHYKITKMHISLNVYDINTFMSNYMI